MPMLIRLYFAGALPTRFYELTIPRIERVSRADTSRFARSGVITFTTAGFCSDVQAAAASLLTALSIAIDAFRWRCDIHWHYGREALALARAAHGTQAPVGNFSTAE